MHSSYLEVDPWLGLSGDLLLFKLGYAFLHCCHSQLVVYSAWDLNVGEVPGGFSVCSTTRSGVQHACIVH